MKPARLEAALGHTFISPELLRQALTHRGYATPNNERLEFLGDSVLNCVIAGLLFQRFPALKEGELHLLRVSLVRQAALAAIAEDIHLGSSILLDKNAQLSGGARSPSILSDALEAVFGAIYLDAGFDVAQRVISTLYAPAIERIDPSDVGKDPKTMLQEILHKRRMSRPVYNLMATRGEEHAKEFDVECLIPDTPLRATGSGRSRRIAEQQAARQVIVELKA